MFKIVYGREAGHWPREMDSLYRLRHRVFKGRMGWEVPSVNGRERDQFDLPEAVYLLSFNKHGEVDGTWRLLPMTGPNMLRDVFSELMEGMEIPASPLIWEMSRLGIEHYGGERQRKAMGGCSMGELFCAAMEYCWSHGIRELVVVHDLRMAKLTRRLLGFPATWESRHVTMDGVPVSAAQYRIVNPAEYRRTLGIKAPLLSPEDSGESLEIVA